MIVKLTTNWILIRCLGILLILQMGCDITKPPPMKYFLSEDRSPSWSPGGKWIVYSHMNFVYGDTSYVTGLYMIDTLGQNRKLIYEGLALSPDWSPNGDSIVFDEGGNIHTISLATRTTKQLTQGYGHHFPSWSPDGELIAYDIAFNDSAGIWIMNTNGAGKEYLWIGRNPDWSPDNYEIVYEGFGGIWKAAIDSSGFILLFEADEGMRNPTWSPDGSQIAWNNEGEVWLMTYNGKDQHKLTEGFDPAWSPDSKQIVFSREADDKIVLYIINIDGTNLKQLTY